MSSADTTAPAAARQFLQALDAEADSFTFQTFDDDADRADKSLARIFNGTLEDHAQALADLNQRGAGVFVTVNETDGIGRKADNIIRVRAVFVDLDGADLEPVMQCPLDPHVVVESSHGKYHAYWLVDDLPQDQFTGVQMAIADRFGGDGSVKDLPRVMRLPGYLHQKQAAFETKVIADNGGLPNPAEKILAEFPPVESPVLACAAINSGDKVTEGGRNNALTSLAGKMRHAGLSPEAIEFALLVENPKQCDPPLPEQEVRDIAASVARYDPPVSASEETLAELAALDPIVYDQQRKGTANRLGIRPTTLDAEVQKRRAAVNNATNGSGDEVQPVAPWPHPVVGASLLDDLVDAFNKYCILPAGAPEALALWVIHSHALDAAMVSPFIALTSPDKRCGKSTVLDILELLVQKPLPAANVTPAALFRAVDKWQPTLLIDEGDTFLKANDDLRGILNAGHTKRKAYVVRCVGDDHDVKRFCVWAPKVIAMIGKMPDTLEDRSINISMTRKLANEKVDRLPAKGDPLLHLARQAGRWALDHMTELAMADPEIPEGLHDRAGDNWRPLLAIADLAGGVWPAKARQAARQLTDEVEEESIVIWLLRDIKTAFSNRGSADWITSDDLCNDLVAMEESPWAEIRQGKPMTTNQLARHLRPLKIRPGQFRIGSAKYRGYERARFEVDWARFTPEPTGTTVQTSETMAYSDSAPGTKPDPVPDGDAPNPLETNTCTVVPVAARGQDAEAQDPGGKEERVAVPKPAPCGPRAPQAAVTANARGGADDDPLAIPPFLRR